MKNFKSILVLITFVLALTVVSCKDAKTDAKTEVTTEKQGKEYASAYVCPMHCSDSGSDKEGKCDTCGMTLVNNEAHKEDGHKHE
jgi:hypothetical protein